MKNDDIDEFMNTDLIFKSAIKNCGSDDFSLWHLIIVQPSFCLYPQWNQNGISL